MNILKGELIILKHNFDILVCNMSVLQICLTFFFLAGYGQKIVIPISQFLNQNMCNKIIVSMTLTSIPTSHRVKIYKVNKRNQVRVRGPSFLQMKWLVTTIYMILIEIVSCKTFILKIQFCIEAYSFTCNYNSSLNSIFSFFAIKRVMLINTVYRVNFARLHLQSVSPRHKFTQTHLCFKRDNLRHRNSPSLKFAH